MVTDLNVLINNDTLDKSPFELAIERFKDKYSWDKNLLPPQNAPLVACWSNMIDSNSAGGRGRRDGSERG